MHSLSQQLVAVSLQHHCLQPHSWKLDPNWTETWTAVFCTTQHRPLSFALGWAACREEGGDARGWQHIQPPRSNVLPDMGGGIPRASSCRESHHPCTLTALFTTFEALWVLQWLFELVKIRQVKDLTLCWAWQVNRLPPEWCPASGRASSRSTQLSRTGCCWGEDTLVWQQGTAR